ncbi:MAG: 50S ribosomal protein L25 [Chloroflexi bacterium]|nr:50S ribosomal protein L25 [Chloroflexota bacterium]|tara:strand:+ start:618 stop:1268 length:651 start_codon:yes stop_codon:yes gene_type:complete
MSILKLKAENRVITGKKVKKLRQDGNIPVHMYGNKEASKNLSIEKKVIDALLANTGQNVAISLEINGENGENVCLIRDVQRHPVTEEVLHIDFLKVDLNKKIQVNIPISIIGTASAVWQLGGTLLQSLQSISVQILPLNIPEKFELDISSLNTFEDSLFVKDVKIDKGIDVNDDLEILVARVMPPRVEEDIQTQEEEVGAAEVPVVEGETEPEPEQ